MAPPVIHRYIIGNDVVMVGISGCEGYSSNLLLAVQSVVDTVVVQLALCNSGGQVPTATFLCENMNSLFCSHYNIDTLYQDIRVATIGLVNILF